MTGHLFFRIFFFRTHFCPKLTKEARVAKDHGTRLLYTSVCVTCTLNWIHSSLIAIMNYFSDSLYYWSVGSLQKTHSSISILDVCRCNFFLKNLYVRCRNLSQIATTITTTAKWLKSFFFEICNASWKFFDARSRHWVNDCLIAPLPQHLKFFSTSTSEGKILKPWTTWCWHICIFA